MDNWGRIPGLMVHAAIANALHRHDFMQGVYEVINLVIIYIQLPDSPSSLEDEP